MGCLMKVVGIDASTKSTGVSLFVDGELNKYQLIKSTHKDVYDRIIEIQYTIEQFVKTNKPDWIFIENVPLANTVNRLVAEHLLVLQGTIFSIAIRYNCNFKPLQPTNWRRLAGVKPDGRKRENQKKAAINLVEELYHLGYKWVDKKYDEKNGDSDICEAILIGMAGIKFLEE